MAESGELNLIDFFDKIPILGICILVFILILKNRMASAFFAFVVGTVVTIEASTDALTVAFVVACFVGSNAAAFSKDKWLFSLFTLSFGIWITLSITAPFHTFPRTLMAFIFPNSVPIALEMFAALYSSLAALAVCIAATTLSVGRRTGGSG